MANENFDYEVNKNNCIIVLKTPRAGETVDNGMGIDFDLKPYALICKDEDTLIISEEEKDKYQIFEIDRCNSLEGMINNLNETDGYEIIWRNPTYKEPEPIIPTIKPSQYVGVDFKINIFYELSVKYEDVKKYYKDRPKPSRYMGDLFIDLLEMHPDFDKIVSNRSFPRDVAHLEETYFNAEGITFKFSCSSHATSSLGYKWKEEDKKKDEKQLDTIYNLGLDQFTKKIQEPIDDALKKI